MRVCCAYTALHPLADAALTRFAPAAERYELGLQTDAYWVLLDSLWRDGESFLLIEHDIEIHADVIPQLEQCGEPWCVLPYEAAGDDDGDRHLYGSLGCTRFGSELLQAHPMFMTNLPVRDWRRLDCEMLPRLQQLGYTQHIHWPAVLSHHVRDGRCDCRQSH